MPPRPAARAPDVQRRCSPCGGRCLPQSGWCPPRSGVCPACSVRHTFATVHHRRLPPSATTASHRQPPAAAAGGPGAQRPPRPPRSGGGGPLRPALPPAAVGHHRQPPPTPVTSRRPSPQARRALRAGRCAPGAARLARPPRSKACRPRCARHHRLPQTETSDSNDSTAAHTDPPTHPGQPRTKPQPNPQAGSITSQALRSPHPSRGPAPDPFYRAWVTKVQVSAACG
jgi:hypothetical protein